MIWQHNARLSPPQSLDHSCLWRDYVESTLRAMILDDLTAVDSFWYNLYSTLSRSKSDSLLLLLPLGTYLLLSQPIESSHPVRPKPLMLCRTPQNVSVSSESSLSPWFKSEATLVFPWRCICEWCTFECKPRLLSLQVIILDSLLLWLCHLTLK